MVQRRFGKWLTAALRTTRATTQIARSTRAGSHGARGKVKMLITALITLTSALGGIAAWRASVASSAAVDNDRQGFEDYVARSQRRDEIMQSLDETAIAYARYSTNDTLADVLQREGRFAVGVDKAILQAEAASHRSLSRIIRAGISPDALEQDGALNLDAKFQVDWAFAVNDADLEPWTDYRKADAFHIKSERLFGITALLITAALFLTLAQISRTRAYALYLGGGVATLSVSVLLLVLVEVP